MAFPQAVDMRASLAFVTDPAYAIYESDSAGTPAGNSYPHTSPQGNTVGWETDITQGLQTRNRNAGNDARLAGTGFTDNSLGGIHTYRIDLPSAGAYNLRCACGEANYARPAALVVRDGTTTLAALSQTATTAANNFRDATDNEYSAANWPSLNTAVSRTFATTICRVDIKDTGVGGALCYLAHFYVESGAPAQTGAKLVFRNRAAL